MEHRSRCLSFRSRHRDLFRRQRDRRAAGAAIRAALDAGKHVYVEKPLAETLTEALDLARCAEHIGLKNGVVQDKLFLPGLTKMRKLYETDFFGRVLSIRLDFGWWVFDGKPYPAQRPSWNYRKATGGGLVLDMFAHWRYIFDRLLGEVKAVSCRHVTALPERRDEAGNPYEVDVEDTAFADIRAGRGRTRAGELFLGEPGQARRSAADPGRWHQRLGGVRAAPLLRTAAGGHPEAVFRPGTAAGHGVRRAMAGNAGHRSGAQRLPRRLGAVP